MSLDVSSRLFSLGKSREIVMISDVHIGAEDFSESNFLATLKYIREHEAFITLNGDIVENSIVDGKAPGEKLLDQRSWPTEQFRWAVARLKPFSKAGRILWVIEGNHEQRTKRKSLLDMSQLLADSLKVPYLLNGGMVRIQCGAGYFDGAVHHGRYASSNVYSELNKMCSIYPRAEFVALGHNHALCSRTVGYIELDKKFHTEIRREVHQIRTGTYLGYPNYARILLAPPTRMGSPILKFDDKNHRISVDCDMLSYMN